VDSPVSPRALAAHDSARVAWEAGDYIDALSRWDRLLSSDESAPLHRDIALTTGEWHPATELSADGRSPQWSRDGRMLAFTSSIGDTPQSFVLDVSGAAPREIAVTDGSSVVFGADGRTIYLIRTAESAAVRAAREQLAAATDVTARRRAIAEVSLAEREASSLVARDLTNGRERTVALPDGLVPMDLMPASDAGVHVLAAEPQSPQQNRLLRITGEDVRRLSDSGGLVASPESAPGVTAWMVGRATRSFGAPGEMTASEPSLVLLHEDGRRSTRPAREFALSADGSTLAWYAVEDGANVLRVIGLADDTSSITVLRTESRLSAPALSPDGRSLAFQSMPREDWELYVWNRDDTEPRRVTREVQHDLFPRFLADGRLLAVIGEARHRRS